MSHTMKLLAAGAVALLSSWVSSTGVAVAAPSGCGAASAIPRAANLERTSEAVVCLVDRERRRRGLRRLRIRPALTRAALAHSIDIVSTQRFSHVGSDGSTARARALRAGYDGAVEETLATGGGVRSTPRRFVALLMSSTLHRRILLGRRYVDLGIGMVIGAADPAIGGRRSGATLTLLFGRP